MEMIVNVMYKPHNNISEKNISFYELKKRYSQKAMFLLMLPKFTPLNLWKPSDFYMWEIVLYFKSTVCPHFVFLFFAWNSQKRSMASLHSISRTWIVISVTQKLIFMYYSNKFHSSQELIIRACWVCKIISQFVTITPAEQLRYMFRK
jgi:hypothetical protein